MSIAVWITVGIVFAVIWTIIIWELITSPIYDSYGKLVEEEDEYQLWIEDHTKFIEKEDKEDII